MKINIGLFFLLLLSFQIANAQLYKCDNSGQIVYQQTPCRQGEQKAIEGVIQRLPDNETPAHQDLAVPQSNKYMGTPWIDSDAHCREKWSGKPDMYRYCLRNERQAERDAGRVGRIATPDILSYCYVKWDTWSMRVYCIKNELEAKDTVFKLTLAVPAIVRRNCMNEWDTWQMRKHCMEKFEK